MKRQVTRQVKRQVTRQGTRPGTHPATRATQGEVRITGGAWRSRVLRFPALQDLRPTSDRVRETLFNWLGQDLTGKTCLDLFAGSGALGFEALSRNAKAVVMVERDARVRAALDSNAKLLQAGLRLTIAGGDALQFLQSAAMQQSAVPQKSQRYDVIFCDPPFREEWFGRLWPALDAVLAEKGLMYAESGAPLQVPAAWNAVKSGKAGQVFYQLLARAPCAAAPAQ